MTLAKQPRLSIIFPACKPPAKPKSSEYASQLSIHSKNRALIDFFATVNGCLEQKSKHDVHAHNLSELVLIFHESVTEPREKRQIEENEENTWGSWN